MNKSTNFYDLTGIPVIPTFAEVFNTNFLAMKRVFVTTSILIFMSLITMSYAANSSKLVQDGVKIYMNGNELPKEEVQKKMANTDAFRLYNKGITKNNNGNLLLGLGIFLMVSGIVLLCCSSLAGRSFFNGTVMEYHFTNKGLWLGLVIAGCLALPSGIGSLAAGITNKVQSTNYISEAVYMYNYQ